MAANLRRVSEHEDAKADSTEQKNEELVSVDDDIEQYGKAPKRIKVSQPDSEIFKSQSRAQHETWTQLQLEPPARNTPILYKQRRDEKGTETVWVVHFDGPSDPIHPHNRSLFHRWAILLILSSCSLCVTSVSSIYSSTYGQVEPAFGIVKEVATLGLTMFVMGLACGPLFLSPLSEFYGRRWIYIIAYGLFVIWLVPCAVAQNLATMLVSRFFDGFVASAFLSVAGETVGDMFPKHRLSFPMMLYTASEFAGPQVGPVIGGFINHYTNWRWTFYVSLMWAGVGWISLILFVPETYAPVLLRRKAQRLRTESGDLRWKAPIEIMKRSVAKTVLWSCIRPFELLFLEPMCLNLCLLSALLLGIIYLFFGAFSKIFGKNYDFNEWQNGLSFTGLFVGLVVGVCSDPITRRNYDRLVRNNGGVSEPEFRLPPTIVGAIIVPIGLFGFAWTTYDFVPWIVPILFSAVFGFGNILCFGGIYTFLVESYPLYAASALAANSFARASFAACFPLFGSQMYDALGFQWASSLLGFIALAMAPFPILFFKIGKRIRTRSRFASDHPR